MMKLINKIRDDIEYNFKNYNSLILYNDIFEVYFIIKISKKYIYGIIINKYKDNLYL